jgi:lipopolysaccharide/colanic/teichoic acid biosynthesis glycosyltransferase
VKPGKRIARPPAEMASPQPVKVTNILPQEAFHKMIMLERKRTERSRKPFLLMLLDTSSEFSSERNWRTLVDVLEALAVASRETDVTGWYATGAVVGVMYTEIAPCDRSAIVANILPRVSNALRAKLGREQFDRIKLSFHVFPEDWNHDDSGRPSNPTLYPELHNPEDSQKRLQAVKRLMDIVGSGLALLMLAPLFLMIAAIVKGTSKGPVFFKQKRVGQQGECFTFLKFRSMYVNNDASQHQQYVRQLITGQAAPLPGADGERGVFKLTNDPRVTPVGRVLRRTSLDELPQFLNVLRGEMSLVGPRPAIPYEVEAYDIWHRRRVLEAKPGITGLWQVQGRSRVAFDEMVRLDLRYVRNWSPWLDLKILWQTPKAVMDGSGAY